MERVIKVAIIEDEIPAARLLKGMLSELRPDWEIVSLPGSVEESVAWFATHPHPDLLFLDIQLIDGLSFSFIEQARPEGMIIFTTAYDEYAVQAFTVNSVDYLLKPISKERLEQALEKFERWVSRGERREEMVSLESLERIFRQASPGQKRYRTRFLIENDNRSFALQVDEIAYFYSESKLTFARTWDGKEHVIDFSLDKLAAQLDPDRFFRLNRQVLACVDSIVKLESYFLGKMVVRLKPPFKERIVVSREKVSLLKEWLDY